MRAEGRGPRAEGQTARPPKVSSFEDLIVWQRSIALVRSVYEVSKSFPSDERYGLTAQVRRAAVSVPSNIAEGHERNSTREFVHFLSNAEGSLAEVRTQVRIAVDLGFCDSSAVELLNSEIIEIKRMLNALRRSLNAKA